MFGLFMHPKPKPAHYYHVHLAPVDAGEAMDCIISNHELADLLMQGTHRIVSVVTAHRIRVLQATDSI